MTDATTKFQVKNWLLNDGFFANFMPASQRFFLIEALDGEEGDFFAVQLWSLKKHIQNVPMTYGTENVETADKVLQLHYFRGGVDAWIIERDVGDGDGLGVQHQAYGKITLFGGGWQEAEWGYISIQELIENGVELDLHWTPKTAKEMK